MKLLKFTGVLLLNMILFSCGNADNQSNDSESSEAEIDSSDLVQGQGKIINYSHDSIVRGFYLGIMDCKDYPTIYTTDAHSDPDNLEQYILEETNLSPKIQSIQIGNFLCTVEFQEKEQVTRVDTSYSGLISTLIWTDWEVMLTVKDSSNSEIYSKKINRDLFYSLDIENYNEFGPTDSPKEDMTVPNEDYFNDYVVYSHIYAENYTYSNFDEIRVHMAFYDDVSYGEVGYEFVFSLNLEELTEKLSAYQACSRCEGFM